MKFIFLFIAVINYAAFVSSNNLANAFGMVLMIWLAIVHAIDEKK